MNFPDFLFSSATLWMTNGLLFGVLLVAALMAPWRQFGAARFNLWLGTVVTLSLIWRLRAGVMPGEVLHLLGATTATLMFGPSFAMLALMAVSVIVAFNVHGLPHPQWMALGMHGLVSVVFPVLVAHGVRRAVDRFLPPHFFVYIFVTVFFGAWLTAFLTGTVSCGVLWLADAYPAESLLHEYLLSYVLLGFAEAWLNGAVITLMVVYLPDWVSSFDDRHYLYRR